MSEDLIASLSCVGVGFFIVGVLFLVWYLQKKNEEKRVGIILAMKDKLGEEFCQWLIHNKIKLDNYKTKAILGGFLERGWDVETCKNLIGNKIAIGMTDIMVLSALGKPSIVDEQVVTEKDNKYRWIYGVPRKGATYFWFRNDKVTKIKT
jgi:hypothetical protein